MCFLYKSPSLRHNTLVMRTFFSSERKTGCAPRFYHRQILILVMMLLLAFMYACNKDYEASTYIGVYSSVSESEWELVVELKPNGDAKITKEAWLAGQYDKRESEAAPILWTHS